MAVVKQGDVEKRTRQGVSGQPKWQVRTLKVFSNGQVKYAKQGTVGSSPQESMT